MNQTPNNNNNKKNIRNINNNNNNINQVHQTQPNQPTNFNLNAMKRNCNNIWDQIQSIIFQIIIIIIIM